MRSSLPHIFDEMNVRQCTEPSSTDRARTKRMVTTKFGFNLIDNLLVSCVSQALGEGL